MRRCLLQLLWLGACLFLLPACVPTKHLAEGEYLLYEQRIAGNQAISLEELEPFYRQKPNRKILYMPMMPYLSAYYLGKKGHDKHFSRDSAKVMRRFQAYLQEQEQWEKRLATARAEASHDTARIKERIKSLDEKVGEVEEKWQLRLKEGNWMMRSVGEPPSIFKQAAMKQTAEQMAKYLHYKGFFSGTVTASADTAGKRIVVTYRVQEGLPYMLDSIRYHIPDTAITRLVRADSAHAAIRTGRRFDEGAFEQERLRILKLLKNNGYYDFSKAYMYFEVDSTIGGHKVAVNAYIKNPPEGKHKAFSIEEVIFDTYADATRTRTNADTIVYRGIAYIQEHKIYSKRVLNRKVFIRPGELYSQTAAEETQRALADLNIFKFVNIKYDSIGGKFKAHIFVSPYPKYQVGLEGGLNVNQARVPGPFVSFSFINRNMLNSADIFEVQARFSLEAQASATNTSNNLRSIQAGANSTLTLPRIFFPIPEQWKQLLAARMPKTQFNIGYAFIERPEYTRANLQGGIAYQWTNKQKANFSFSLLDIGIINTTTMDSLFRESLIKLRQQGNTLINSFDRSLVSSTLFSYTKVSGDYGSKTSVTQYFRAHLENGGPSAHALNKYLLGNKETFLGLRYYRFYKLSLDYRASIPLGNNGQIATRMHGGVANAYSSNHALPYEKYFFSGGSSSNRAWRARRVGPGDYRPENDNLEQYGEMLLEANAELRSHLFGFIEGALFLDATNIWMLREDPNRIGSKFELKDFWKELAIGGGFGVRLDFSFMLIRFDVGVQLHNPSLPLGERWLLEQISWRRPLGTKEQHIFNVGIGYPF